MRIAALDVGSRRIGIALSDPLGYTAQPDHVMERRGTRADVASLLAFCAERGVTELVLGLPLELDGTEAQRARRVRVLFDALVSLFAGPVHLWDERLTTVAAERVMLEADLSRRRRKQSIDMVAAALILQGFLDHRRLQAARELEPGAPLGED
ncbi:MAG: Holliday junction resolvase RuvX [Polyangia bacterium]|nr:Holliday junction resolvase RuvX [Polyangia bacterium]